MTNSAGGRFPATLYGAGLITVCLAACDDSIARWPQVCDIDDPKGPPCVQQVRSAAEFIAITAQLTKSCASPPCIERQTKFMVPAADEPDLLPPLWQNVNRYDVHATFLVLVFPDRFAGLSEKQYSDMVHFRSTRKYFAGNFSQIRDAKQGQLFGFTVWTAAAASEALELDEVRRIYQLLAEPFSLGALAYTFELSDANGPAKAKAWSDPGFPIYFFGSTP